MSIFRRRPKDSPTGTWKTGTGQILRNVHPKSTCAGEPCSIHSPSDHSMRKFDTHWRGDRGMMERICPHGVGHPDPDHLAHIARAYGKASARTESVHGCDGCCKDAYDVSMFSPSVQDEVDTDCIACGEECARNECQNSMTKCGHHCNHSWTHDSCCWCLVSWGEDGVEFETSGPASA